MIPDVELIERFVRASGPGGQNVNKVSTAVELRFDAQNSPSLSPRVKARLKTLAGRRMNNEGVIVILAQTHRTQEMNRDDAKARLFALLAEASKPPPPPRKATKPTMGAVRRRLKAKAVRSGVKSMRGKIEDEE